METAGIITKGRSQRKSLHLQYPPAILSTVVFRSVSRYLYDGNYSLVVSNDFGTITTPITTIDVKSTPTVPSISLELTFCPPGTFTMGSPTTEAGRDGRESFRWRM